MSLAPPDSISTSAPYCPTNFKVLEAMAKFQSKSNTEQLNVAPCSARGTDHLNSSSVSNTEQAVLQSDENMPIATAVDGAIAAGSAMVERSPTRSPTSREGIHIQQLHRDDREGAGCVCFVDSPLPSVDGNGESASTPVDADKPVGNKSTNSVNIFDGGVVEVDSCSYIATSLVASTIVLPEGVERQRLTAEAVGGWQRPRGLGRGRGRIIPLSESGPGVSDSVVGSHSVGSRPTSLVGGGRIGRGRARSIMRLPYNSPDKDLSIERSVASLENVNGPQTNESGSAVMLRQCEGFASELSVGAAEEGALGIHKLRGTPQFFSGPQGFASDIGQFSDGHFQLTSTPTHTQTIYRSNESDLLTELPTRPATGQIHNTSLPTTEAVRGWQRLRGLGRGRGRILPFSESESRVNELVVGSHSIGSRPTSLVGGGRIGRGRARSIMRLPYNSPDKDLSIDCSAASRTILPEVVDAESCQCCKVLHDTVTAMESKLSKLSEMVAEHDERLNQINRQKTSNPSVRLSDEIFTDKRLMRIKAAAFITGRPLSAHMCKQLVFHMYDNEPPCMFNIDHIKAINEQRECRDAQSLSKWAVFETFSLQELVGRNCLGGGRDSSADEIKKPFDECKMQIIKNAVFHLYPQHNDAMRKAAWMKCVDKINTDVRYLFKVSLKKAEWLQLGI